MGSGALCCALEAVVEVCINHFPSQAWDESTGAEYFYNTATGESSWYRPVHHHRGAAGHWHYPKPTLFSIARMSSAFRRRVQQAYEEQVQWVEVRCAVCSSHLIAAPDMPNESASSHRLRCLKSNAHSKRNCERKLNLFEASSVIPGMS